REGGEVAGKIELDRGAFACMLGGDDGKTLYICTATGSGPHARTRTEGRIETVRVEIPHAGLP
ncbi:MAG: gluconolactonase, partial [Gammaproteobacteria bacterium]|nr:gluconolactonase [Gammaproteobacteria bacterium]